MYWYAVDNVDPHPTLPKKQDKDSVDRWGIRNREKIDALCHKNPSDLTGSSVQDVLECLAIRRSKIKRRFDGFKTIQNGIAKKHKSIEFRRSGAIGYDLFEKKLKQEKTVDVNLAVDMVRMADNYDLALIVSGDQDYVPAAQAVKNMGKHVVNIAFKARNGMLLPGGAKRLNHMTDWSFAVEYEKFKEFLRL